MKHAGRMLIILSLVFVQSAVLFAEPVKTGLAEVQAAYRLARVQTMWAITQYNAEADRLVAQAGIAAFRTRIAGLDAGLQPDWLVLADTLDDQLQQHQYRRWLAGNWYSLFYEYQGGEPVLPASWSTIDPLFDDGREALGEAVVESLSLYHPLQPVPVFVRLEPNDTLLQTLATKAAGSNGSLVSQSRVNSISILGKSDFYRFEADPSTPGLFARLMDAWKSDKAILVNVRRLVSWPGVSSWYADASLLEKNEPLPVSNGEGFAFSRTAGSPWWMVALLVPLGLMMALSGLLSQLNRPGHLEKNGSIRSRLGSSIFLAFAICLAGRFLIPLLSDLAIGAIMPSADLPAAMGVWWVVAWSAMTFIIPLAILYVLLERFSAQIPDWISCNVFGTILVPLGAGLWSYVMSLMLLNLSDVIWQLTIAATVACWLMGAFAAVRHVLLSVDNEASLVWLVLPVVSLVMGSFGIANGDGLIVVVCTAGAAVISMPVSLRAFLAARRRRRRMLALSVPQRHSEDGISVVFEKAPLHVSRHVKTLQSKVAAGQVQLILAGPAGWGKRSAIEHAVRSLPDQAQRPVVYLSGSCKSNAVSGGAFSYFISAFEPIYHLNHRNAVPGAHDLLGSILNQVVPFSSLIMPSAEINGSFADKQLRSTLLRWFYHTCSQARVFLVIENLQCIDPDSLDLLLEVAKQAPAWSTNAGNGLSILASWEGDDHQNSTTIQRLRQLNWSLLYWPAWDARECEHFMVQSYRMPSVVAADLVSQFRTRVHMPSIDALMAFLRMCHSKGLLLRKQGVWQLQPDWLAGIPAISSFDNLLAEAVGKDPELACVLDCCASVGAVLPLKTILEVLGQAGLLHDRRVSTWQGRLEAYGDVSGDFFLVNFDIPESRLGINSQSGQANKLLEKVGAVLLELVLNSLNNNHITNETGQVQTVVTWAKTMPAAYWKDHQEQADAICGILLRQSVRALDLYAYHQASFLHGLYIKLAPFSGIPAASCMAKALCMSFRIAYNSGDLDIFKSSTEASQWNNFVDWYAGLPETPDDESISTLQWFICAAYGSFRDDKVLEPVRTMYRLIMSRLIAWHGPRQPYLFRFFLALYQRSWEHDEAQYLATLSTLHADLLAGHNPVSDEDNDADYRMLLLCKVTNNLASKTVADLGRDGSSLLDGLEEAGNQALQNLEDNLARREILGDLQGKTMDHGLMADLYRLKGDWSKAAEHYREDLAISREISDSNGISKCLVPLAICQFQLDQTIYPATLQSACEQALAMDDPATLARLLIVQMHLEQSIPEKLIHLVQPMLGKLQQKLKTSIDQAEHSTSPELSRFIAFINKPDKSAMLALERMVLGHLVGHPGEIS